jgi:hypothetical protein
VPSLYREPMFHTLKIGVKAISLIISRRRIGELGRNLRSRPNPGDREAEGALRARVGLRCFRAHATAASVGGVKGFERGSAIGRSPSSSALMVRPQDAARCCC